jgi:CRP-like cAMP-binding protein
MSQLGLEAIDLLAALPPEELQVFADQCRWRSVSEQTLVLGQDDDVTDVFFVVEGAVRLSSFTLAGREIFFGTVRAGDYFGEVSTGDGVTRRVGALTLEDSRFAVMPGAAFRKALAAHPEVLERVIDRLATIVQALDERVMDLYTLPAPMRVYAELLRLAEPDAVTPNSWVIWPMRTCSDIASRAHTTRETATRAISELVGKGVVERVSKSLYIRDRDELSRLSGKERQ